jgi:hypothetical protein
MAETAFRIAYDGPALEFGRMPVRDLAPALLALGDLFAEAGRVVYPDSAPVALNIKATEQGSFDVHLILEAEDLWDQFVDLFGSDPVTALVNLKTLIVGGGGFSLFGLIRLLRGRQIEREEASSTPGYVRITVEDTSIEIPAEVATMYRRISIRRKARDVVAPLNREGVEEVQFAESPDAPPELIIGRTDVPSYEAAAAEEGDVLLDEEREMVLQIAGVSFEGRKWRLSDGTVTFWASIEDEVFLADVEGNKERFGNGDLLRCRTRVVQTRRASKLHTDYRVIQVIQHIPGHTQPELWE